MLLTHLLMLMPVQTRRIGLWILQWMIDAIQSESALIVLLLSLLLLSLLLLSLLLLLLFCCSCYCWNRFTVVVLVVTFVIIALQTVVVTLKTFGACSLAQFNDDLDFNNNVQTFDYLFSDKETRPRRPWRPKTFNLNIYIECLTKTFQTCRYYLEWRTKERERDLRRK